MTALVQEASTRIDIQPWIFTHARQIRTAAERPGFNLLFDPRQIAVAREIDDLKNLWDRVHQPGKPAPIFMGLSGDRISKGALVFTNATDMFIHDFYTGTLCLRRGKLALAKGDFSADYEPLLNAWKAGFPLLYPAGYSFPQPIIDKLVRPLEVVIITNGRKMKELENLQRGPLSSVPLKLRIVTPWSRQEELGELTRHLETAIPLAYPKHNYRQ